MKIIDEKIIENMFSRDVGKRGIQRTYSKFMRYLAFPIVSVLVYTPITANQVSTLAVSSNLLAALCFAFGSLGGYITGLFFLFLGQVLDYVDGSIARYKKEVTSMQSSFLCRMYHIGSLSFLFVGIGVGVYQNTQNPVYLFLGLFAGFIQQTTIYVLELKNSVLLNHQVFSNTRDIKKSFVSEKNEKKVLRIFALPIDLEILELTILFAIIFSKLEWFLIFYGIYLPLRALIFFIGTYYKIKEIEGNEVAT